jgi:hypothetical protein
MNDRRGIARQILRISLTTPQTDGETNMGDRCSVEILCHKDDATRFEALNFVRATWGEQPGHLVRMFEE